MTEHAQDHDPVTELAEAETSTAADELEHGEAVRRSRRRTRGERRMGRRPRTLKARELVQEARRQAEPLLDWAVREEVAQRPRSRADCEPCPTCEAHRELESPPPVEVLACGHRASQALNHCRPCPWVGCRMNLFLDVNEGGYLQYTHPGVDLEDMRETCALDVADRGKHTREQVGDLLNMTGQRVTTIERDARVHLRVMLGVQEGDDP